MHHKLLAGIVISGFSRALPADDMVLAAARVDADPLLLLACTLLLALFAGGFLAYVSWRDHRRDASDD